MNTQRNSDSTALATISADVPFTSTQIDLIRSQIAPEASDDQLALFLEVCRGTGLNPFMRQIYAVSRNAKEKNADGNWHTVKRMTIQTGIDGYRLLAARTGQLAGIDDAVFDTEDAEHPNKASVIVWRFVAGQRVAFTATARWREYVQEKDEYRDGQKTSRKIPTEMWAKMPYGMLAKCAEALALRKAFPAELSGVYTAEEMMQADNESLPTSLPSRATQSTRDPSIERRIWRTEDDPVEEHEDALRAVEDIDSNQRADEAAQIELVQWLKEGQFGTVLAVERFLADTLKRRMTIAALQRGASNITIGEVEQVTNTLAARREAQQKQQQAPATDAAVDEAANNFEDLPALNGGVKP